MLEIKWKKLCPGAIIPTSAYDHAGAFDLYIPDDAEPFNLYSYNRMTFPLGLACEFSPEYMMHFAIRSGSAKNSGLTLVNTPSIIDPDYRGELALIILNTGHVNQKILPGGCYAQAWLAPRFTYLHTLVEELTPTTRGDNGFGSSTKLQTPFGDGKLLTSEL